MKIRAPAKINLRLRVVGKRADGYHLLDTIMLPVSLWDEIDIRRLRGRAARDTLVVTCDHPGVPAGSGNLVFRAARLLLDRQRYTDGIRIHIKKRIPLGAGLGGGSTDAAATLVGLNRLLKFKLSEGALRKAALTLGADVPFFISGRPARARGIGEKLTPLPPLPALPLVLIYPNIAVSTAWVFGNLRVKLTKSSLNNSIKPSLMSSDRLRRFLVNDLETVALRRYPQIGLQKNRLIHEGALGALMSGSGSAVFGVFESWQKANAAYRRLRKEEGVQAFLVKVLK